MTWHLDDYCCTLLRGILRHSFQETSPRNTTENTAKHRCGGVDSVVANHRGGGESSMVVTTLLMTLCCTAEIKLQVCKDAESCIGVYPVVCIQNQAISLHERCKKLVVIVML